MPDGSQAKAQEVDFQPQAEVWNQYLLQDGTTVKVKTTVLKILQVLDDKGNPARTVEGDPFLIVNHRIDVIASG